MKLEAESQMGLNKKKIIAAMGIIFIVSVMLLSFFSKTIANLSLQKVTIARGTMNYLKQEARYEGKASFEKEIKVVAPTRCKVKGIYVKVGEQVKAGQLLCKVEGNNSQYDLKKKQLDLEKNQLNYKYLADKVADLDLQYQKAKEKLDSLNKEAEAQKEERTKQMASQVKGENELDLEAAEKKLEVSEALYEVGALAKADLEAARVAVEKLKLKIKENQEIESKEAKAEEKAYQTAVESQETLLDALLSQKKQVTEEMESNQLNQKGLQLELEQLMENTLPSGEILATTDGVVLELNMTEGEQIVEGQEMLRMGSLEAGEKVDFIVSEDQNLLAIGDSIYLHISSLKQNQLLGSVTSIKNSESGLMVEAHFECPQMTGNEKVDIEVTKQTEEQHLIIPYSAINKEKTGYFVYEVLPVEDAMGSGYKVRKSRVQIGRHSLDSVEIIDGITQSACVVVSSEKTILPGMKVKIENEEVFYSEAPNE